MFSKWSGILRASLVSCPVRLAPVLSDVHVTQLKQINARTGNPVVQQLIDSCTGDVVDADSLVIGFQTASSDYVAISMAELEGLASVPANIIEVAHVLPRDQIDPARLDASCYIEPDGTIAPETLGALRLAMQRQGCDAIGYVRLGMRERMVLIQVFGGALILSTLRPSRVPEPAEVARLPESTVPAESVAIAEAVIGRLRLNGNASEPPDRYEVRLGALLAAKATRTHTPQLNEAATPTSPPRGTAAELLPNIMPPPPNLTGASPEEFGPTTLAAEPEAEAEAAEPSAELAGREAGAPPESEPAAVDAMPAAAKSGSPLNGAGRPSESGINGSPHELGAEVLLQIMGLGEHQFVEQGWAGRPASGQRIEALSIRPRQKLEPTAIEFRAFGADGRATPWVSNGNHAGTRGLNLPLTGFAVRPVPELRDQIDIVYEGCFAATGVVGPRRNGEICTSPVLNDALEAVRVKIIERQASAVDQT